MSPIRTMDNVPAAELRERRAELERKLEQPFLDAMQREEIQAMISGLDSRLLALADHPEKPVRTL